MQLPHLYTDDNGIICSSEHSDGFWTSKEASAEMARRCNAFPLMLEALEAMLSFHDGDFSDEIDTYDFFCEAIAKARVALAKAKGES